MVSFTYTIKVEAGVHARPAGMITKEANQYDSAITIKMDDKEVDGKNLLAIMSMCIQCGTEVTVCAEGKDEKEAIAAVEQVFEEYL